MKRKLLSLLLALALLLTLLPQATPAARAEDKAGKDQYSGWCGDSLTWTFDPDTGVLAIEGDGYMWMYSSSDIPWSLYREQITEVTLPTDLRDIAAFAFFSCTALTSVKIPGSVERIDSNAFENCTALTELTIPGSVEHISISAFEGCTALSSVFLCEGVKYIYDSAFGHCTSLKELCLPDSLRDIGQNAFEFTALTSVVLPLSLESLESCAFYGCTDLTDLTFLNPGCEIAFDCLRACGEVTICGFTRSTAERFAAEKSLPFVPFEDITVSGDCGDKLTWSFHTGTGLLTFTGSGEMWNYDYWEHPAPWFYYAELLTAVSFPAGITRIGDSAFLRCKNLTAADIPEGVTGIGHGAFSGCLSLSALTLPQSLTSIGSSAMECCVGLTEITVPDNVVEIGGSAFSRCTGLRSVSLPEGLISINNNTFDDCLSLTAIDFPDSLEYIGREAFYRCESLTSVILPANLTKLDSYAFQECSGLTAVAFPDGLAVVDWGAFMSCSSLVSVTLPASLKELPPKMFWHCGNLRSVTFSAGLEYIGNSAFSCCDRLTSLVLPEGLIEIDRCAFADCENLSSVSFPSSLKTIGVDAFVGCNSLRSVDLPKSVEKLETWAFDQCSSLKTLIVRNPACKVCCYKKILSSWGSDEWYDFFEDNYTDALGLKAQLIVYAPHDAEKENAPMTTETEAYGGYQFTYGYLYIENYAKTNGYTFYATNVFKDVKPGKFYEIPVAWAYGESITSGKDETHFAPNETCTRGQVVTFLWNAMGNPAPTITDCPFVDVKPGKFYYDAMLWALETGVTSGKDETHFAPNESCTRGQVVTFIWNAMGKPEPTITDCPFVDVTPGKYYYTAMLWALENGITAGLDETHFGPNQTCNRAQVVTFLYNALS